MKLNRTNVEKEFGNYLKQVNSIKLPTLQDNILEFIYSLKRNSFGSGPSPDVSLFEASNRILSDIVILRGVQLLLNNLSVGHVQLPFSEYEVKLGIERGNDLTAITSSCSLVSEAFNVAPLFFQTKKASVIRKLQSQGKVNYRLIIFNADAVENPYYYIEKSEPSMLYLPVDILRQL